MSKNFYKILIAILVVGFLVVLFVFIKKTNIPMVDDGNPIIKTESTNKNVNLLESFSSVPIMSLLKTGEYFVGSDKICTPASAVNGKKQECFSNTKREINLSDNLRATLKYDSETGSIMWFYTKSDIPLIAPENHYPSFDYFYFVDEKNILVIMPEDEAPSSVYYYNGNGWKYLPDLISPLIQKFYSPDYGLYNVLPMADFSINKDLILKVQEPNPDQYIGTSGPYQADPNIKPTQDQFKDNNRHKNAGYYTFFIDLKNMKIIESYLTHYDENTKQNLSYSLKDAAIKFPEFSDLFLGKLK